MSEKELVVKSLMDLNYALAKEGNGRILDVIIDAKLYTRITLELLESRLIRDRDNTQTKANIDSGLMEILTGVGTIKVIKGPDCICSECGRVK